MKYRSRFVADTKEVLFVKKFGKSVKEYVQSLYDLNSALRTGTRLGAKQQAQIDALDEAIAGAKLTENKRLNRFVIVHTSSLLRKMEKLDVGDLMEDPGYTSATGNKEKFDRAVDRMSDDTYLVLVDIMAPKGSAALGVKEYLGAMEGDAFFEDEYLFPRDQKFRILKKTTEGRRIKFTVQVLPTMNKALNLEPRAAVASKHDHVKKGETSPWKAHRQLEGVALDTVSSRLLSLFLEIRKQWLHQKSEFHKASGTELFRLNGRIYINPSTGKPLTQKQWGEVLKSLDSSLRAIFKDQPDILVKRALLLGKILRGMEYESRKETDLSSIPASQFQYPKDPEWENARTFAEQHAAELITDIQSDARKKISTTILDSIKGKQTVRQLETALFDKFADLNRDWRMIAETEMATNVNAGILIAESQDREPGETVYMIGVTAGDACPDCVRLIKNKIVVLSDEPVASGRKKIDGEEYEVIWAGKNNIGRKSGAYWACTPLHPHCRCSWTRYYPEMKDLLGLGKAIEHFEKSKYIKREGTPGHYKYWYSTPSPSAKNVMAQYQSRQVSREEIEQYLKTRGLTYQDYEEAIALLYKHNVANTPEHTKEIMSVWKSDSNVSKVMHVMADWNEWQVRHRKVRSEMDFKAVLQRLAKIPDDKWGLHRMYFEGGKLCPTKSRYLKFIVAKSKGEQIFYRRGTYDNDVISMTGNPKGADTGVGRIQPDSWHTLREMNESGFRLVIGARGMVGLTSAKEDEFIFIRDRKAIMTKSVRELGERKYYTLLDIFTGNGARRPDSEFNQIELAVGTQIEQEHTNKSHIAKLIAKDHLTEREDYYKQPLFKEERARVVKSLGKEDTIDGA